MVNLGQKQKLVIEMIAQKGKITVNELANIYPGYMQRKNALVTLIQYGLIRAKLENDFIIYEKGPGFDLFSKNNIFKS